MAFWVLVDSTQLARLKPTTQGVARPTNREICGRRSYDRTNRITGVGRTDSPTNEEVNGRGAEGVGGHMQGTPHN